MVIMLKNVFFVGFLLLVFSAFSVAEVTMLFPENVSLKPGDSVLVGFVSPGQTFDLVFSDNSGFDFEWDSASVDKASLPQNWEFVSSQSTDTSVSVTLKVPVNAAENIYVVPVRLSSSSKPNYEVVNVKVGVKQGLISVSFSRVSPGRQYKLGEPVEYSVQVVNSSIANDSVLIEANLPSNWFAAKKIVVKSRGSSSASLFVVPQSYGKRDFYLTGSVLSSGVVVQSFSSEIEVAPTLKGKFSAPLSGFPFFTFALSPFQLFDSLISVFMK
jgi:hypothetical protein